VQIGMGLAGLAPLQAQPSAFTSAAMPDSLSCITGSFLSGDLPLRAGCYEPPASRSGQPLQVKLLRPNWQDQHSS
jgi:hypothetical protein